MLFVSLNLATLLNHGQLRWFDLFWKTLWDSKQDTSTSVMFDVVCMSKFGNFAESLLIELVGPVPGTV